MVKIIGKFKSLSVNPVSLHDWSIWISKSALSVLFSIRPSAKYFFPIAKFLRSFLLLKKSIYYLPSEKKMHGNLRR